MRACVACVRPCVRVHAGPVTSPSITFEGGCGAGVSDTEGQREEKRTIHREEWWVRHGGRGRGDKDKENERMSDEGGVKNE